MKKIDSNGFWRIDNNPISKVGIYPYLGKQISPELIPDKIYMVYRPAEELFSDEAIESFNENPVPLINDHTMIGAQFTAPEKKGIDGVINNFRRNGDVLVGDISIFSEDMKSCIEGGKKELSMGYFCNYDLTPGTYNGQHYDAIQRDIRSNHVALVDHGRMGSDVRVYDAFCFDAMDATISKDIGFVEFKEEDHPRDKDGKFSKKGDGESSGSGKNNSTFSHEMAKNNKTALEDDLFVNIYEDYQEKIYKHQSHDFIQAVGVYSGSIDFGNINEEVAKATIEGGELSKSTKDILIPIVENAYPLGYDCTLRRITESYELENLLSEDDLKKISYGDFSNLDGIKSQIEDKTLVIPNMYSTTKNDNFSELTGSVIRDKKIAITISATPDTVGTELGNLSGFEGENEVILPPGTKLRINNVKKSNIVIDRDGQTREMLEIEVTPISMERTKDFYDNQMKNNLLKRYQQEFENEIKNSTESIKQKYEKLKKEYKSAERQKDSHVLTEHEDVAEEKLGFKSQICKMIEDKENRFYFGQYQALKEILPKYEEVLRGKNENI